MPPCRWASTYETWPVKSQTFKRYLAKCFFDEHGKAMNSDAASAAVNLMEAKALFEGEEHPIHVRVAWHEGKVYVDLCNAGWQVIEISGPGLADHRRVSGQIPAFQRNAGLADTRA